MEEREFNNRVFTSVGMFITLCGLPVSGLMNHYLGFSPLTQGRHMWMTIHNILGIFFVFFGTWHIALNRKSLWNYLKKATSAATCREAITAIVLVSSFVLLGIAHTIVAAHRH